MRVAFPFTPECTGQDQLQAIDLVPFQARSSDTTEHTTLTQDPIQPFDHDTTAEEINTDIIYVGLFITRLSKCILYT